ncbi:unnamed protein product [Rhizophagus irregularis]|nr:unnamed protein product [Rhizophagus irregularis]
MKFINAPIGYRNLITKTHPQARYTSQILGFTSEKINEILEEYLKSKIFEAKQKEEDAEKKLIILENVAEIYYQSSQNELKEMYLAYQNIKLELVSLQQKNFQLEQNYQNLRLSSAVQIREFAEKENTLQDQIICLQNEKNEKQALAGNLTEQLEQNKLTNWEVQIQINQLEQEKMNLQEKLAQTEANIQELKFQQESLIGQKEQLENKLSQSQVNCEQIEKEKMRLHNMLEGLSQDQKLTIKLKAKLEKELAQLEQKLINEEQIKEQLTQALQIKEDKINELEQKLIGLDYERIKKLNNRRKKLNEVEKELVNKLTSGENTKNIHKEKEAKQKERNELKQELSRTSASYNANRKKLVFNQVNNFLKAKGDFLTLREEAIRKLQNCYTSKERNTIRITRDMVSVEDKISKINVVDRHTKEFQNILIKYNNGLLQLNKKYYSLKNIVQENKDLKISPMIKNILKLDSFSLDRHNIFRFATNSQEGARTQLNSSMMAEDINSLRKNLNELKSELKQEKKELNNLTTD